MISHKQVESPSLRTRWMDLGGWTTAARRAGGTMVHRWTTVGAWVATAAAMVTLWWPTLVRPILTTWTGDALHPDAHLWVRLWRDGVYYFGAPFILFAVAGTGWRGFRTRRYSVGRSRAATVTGWITLVLGVALQLGAARLAITFVSGWALLAVCVAMLLLLGGVGLLRALWLPVIILGFLPPRPDIWVNPWMARLNVVVCTLADHLVYAGTGLASLHDEQRVYFATGRTLNVGSLCAVHAVLSLVILHALLWAALPRLRRGMRLALVPLTLLVTLTASILRVAAEMWLTTQAPLGESGAWGYGWLFNGVVMVVALATPPLLVTGTRLVRAGRPAALPAQAHSHDQDGELPRPSALSIVVLLVAAGWGWSLAAQAAREQSTTRLSAPLLPAVLVVQGVDWTGQIAPWPQFERQILQTNDCTQGTYTAPDGRQQVLVHMGFSNNLRNGLHPPEICGRRLVVSRQDVAVPQADGTTIPMRALVLTHNGMTGYQLFTYVYPGAYTRSYSRQQAMTAWAALCGRRNTGGLVSVTVQIHGGDVEHARHLAQTVAGQILPGVARAVSAD